MDVAEAFLNDPYDWDGPHEPIVAATESDMDGALTMQIFKLLTGFPVLSRTYGTTTRKIMCGSSPIPARTPPISRAAASIRRRI